MPIPEQLLQRAASPAPAVARGVRLGFALAAETWQAGVAVDDGMLSLTPETAGAAFTLRGDDATWSRLLDDAPQPGWQSVLHLVRTGSLQVEGDERAYFRHLHVVRTVVEGSRRPTPQEPRVRRPLTARGSYARVSSALGTGDVFVERCGQGPQLLALATAGSDTSQWHGLMTDTDLTDRYELVTVDLPWHGKSSPTFGREAGAWRLTPDAYTEFIVAAADAIGLAGPVLVGASMAGAAVVHAVATHPHRFAGAVACQAGHRVANRASDLLRAVDVDQSTLVPEWTYGLMNPQSPEEFRTRVWWGYSSGGHGLYAADIDSYLQWDFDRIAAQLTPGSPHIAVLSGRFDTTVPPAASRALAEAIPNASFAEMPELGHFPHAENPARFAPYLEDALTRVLGTPSPSAAGAAASRPEGDTPS
ncbi:alpha/beta fold hydrolase [Microbacterium sp. GXF7504]